MTEITQLVSGWTLSEARFGRYLLHAQHDRVRALNLYHWNARVSQSLYIALQMWEFCLRNKLNGFLCSTFGPNWPRDVQHALRQFAKAEKRKIVAAIRQRESIFRRNGMVSTDEIVTELSVGFWVALFNEKYDLRFSWRHNMGRIFPNDPHLDQKTAREMLEDIRLLRNRIAHHEPIYHLQLEKFHEQLMHLLKAMD